MFKDDKKEKSTKGFFTKEKEISKPKPPSKLSIKIKKLEDNIDQIKEDVRIIKSRLGL
jgi:hypothetical protein